jgi:hypothetical protein
MSGNNRWAGTAFREEVVDYLREQGYPDAQRSRPTAVKPSEHMREDLPDLLGVPDLAMMCRTRGEDRSTPLLLARSSAESHGLPFYGYALQRRGRDVEDSYYVTDLSNLVRMLGVINPAS